MKNYSFLLIGAILLLSACQKVKHLSYTDTIEVNGQSLFYAVEGMGKPVLLIHGNGGSHHSVETTQRQLASAGYSVFAPDSRGQGDNAPLSEYHYADMAEDMYQFIVAKGLEKPAVFGWSDGGIIALILESMHPGTCSLIITSGANITAEDSIDPELFREIFGDTTNMSPLVKMMYREPNMTAEDMARIQCPALICAGENDLILPEHTQLIAELIPQAQAYFVPGHDHGSHIWHNNLMGDIILDFFKKNNY